MGGDGVTRLVQISDLHITEGDRLTRGGADPRARTQALVAAIETLEERAGPIDGVVITGDLTDDGTVEQCVAARALLEPLLNRLHLVPGNHDTRSALSEVFPEHFCPVPEDRGAGVAPPPLHWTRKIGGLTVVGLDTTVPDAAHGELDDRGFRILEDALETAQALVILMHHHPFDAGNRMMDARRLRDGEALIDLVSSATNVRLLACGHVHRYVATTRGRVTCVAAPAASYATMLDHREVAPAELMLDPPALLLHVWDPENDALVTSLAIAGDVPGPMPFFPSTGRP
ncbi:MAG: metallophosphoesterase [Pseudomonadota bacterium]